MRVHSLSDLHLEHMKVSERRDFFKKLGQMIKAEPVDTVVLAGDVGSIYRMEDLLALLGEFADLYKNVVYVPGNHEFFACNIVDSTGNLRDAIDDLNVVNSSQGVGTVYLLEPGNRVVIEGNVFAGGTGWYPNCGERFLKKQWIDYRRIEDCDPEAEALNGIFVEKNLLCEDKVDVMVSHMMPSRECIGGRWVNAWTNIFFLMGIDGCLETLPREKMPKIWFFGHTHDPKNFISIHGFRGYCNPLGYTNEGANPNFWDRLVVEF